MAALINRIEEVRQIRKHVRGAAGDASVASTNEHTVQEAIVVNADDRRPGMEGVPPKAANTEPFIRDIEAVKDACEVHERLN